MNTIAHLPPHHGDPERSAEILGRVRTAFAEKGFDGASMQDLARAAGMSVGNFYRYFPSKDALVEAMVSYDMAQMEADFATIRTSADPVAALRAKIRERILGEGCGDQGRMWAEITAASHRKPEIARICCGIEDLVAGNLVSILASGSNLPAEAAAARFGAEARFVVLLVKAAAMRRHDQSDPDLEALILQTIETTLNAIVAAART
ncbi:MAG: TetR/AcrR family transcriptional regulator [Tabrizicola sp.]|nr:TetR/AcrR family transcriptional regulator [Tabrizicola sp.]